MRSALRWLALLFAVALMAAACGDGDDDDDAGGDGGGGGDGDAGQEAPAAGEAACDETVPGTELNWGVFAPTASLDPPQVSGALVGGTEIAAIYDTLMRFDHENNEFVPKLAESLEPNEDFTEWTLTLREGITYSDGTPLTAQLVSDNMDRFLEEGVRNTSGGFLLPITEKTVVDDTTLQMTLETSWAEFPFVFSDEPGMVVNLNAIGDDPEAFGAQPPDAAGLGPYVVERNAPGEELVLRARDDYWDGPVCVETVRFSFVPGSQATYEAFNAGDFNVAFLRDPVVINEARDAGDDGFFVPQDAGALVIFNEAEGRPGADPRVREAAALALDPEVVNQRAYQGELDTGKAFVLEASRFFSDAIEELSTDPDRATELVEEAKADGWDGSIEIFCADNPPASEVAIAVEGLWEAVGMDVEVRTISQSDQIGEVVQGNYDAACWGFNSGPATGITSYLRNLDSESTSNRMSYASEEMDAALLDLLAASDEEELQEAVAEVNRINNEDFVTVSYGTPEEGIVWKPDVKGLVPTSATIFLLDKVSIEE
jgi:peptide/nickel transport system substrate-binding protein